MNKLWILIGRKLKFSDFRRLLRWEELPSSNWIYCGSVQRAEMDKNRESTPRPLRPLGCRSRRLCISRRRANRRRYRVSKNSRFWLVQNIFLEKQKNGRLDQIILFISILGCQNTFFIQNCLSSPTIFVLESLRILWILRFSQRICVTWFLTLWILK